MSRVYDWNSISTKTPKFMQLCSIQLEKIAPTVSWIGATIVTEELRIMWLPVITFRYIDMFAICYASSKNMNFR